MIIEASLSRIVNAINAELRTAPDVYKQCGLLDEVQAWITDRSNALSPGEIAPSEPGCPQPVIPKGH